MNAADYRNLCVAGAGIMGQQIALNAALHGFRVALTDISAEALKKAEAWAISYLDGRVEKGKMTPEQKAEGIHNIRFTASLESAAADADIVIEAVAEKLEIKRSLFAELDTLCPPHTILATNSSSLVSSKIADATQRPEKVLNMHFFNPALVMELVEVVQGPHTAAETAEITMEIARRMGKLPILLKKEINGFVANRILGVIFNEACHLLEQDIASVEDIDLAVEKALRHPMGPFKLMDMSGLDTCYLVRVQRFAESGREQDRPPVVMKKMYEQGTLGRKTGKGFYEYAKKS